MTEYRFTTKDGHWIVVEADDRFKTILGSYPTYSPRSGLVFRIDAEKETDVRMGVDIISNEVRTLLGRATRIKGKNLIEYCGQSSLDSEQMMSTITMALEQDAGITQEQPVKVSRLRKFMARHGSRKVASSDISITTRSDSAETIAAGAGIDELSVTYCLGRTGSSVDRSAGQLGLRSGRS